jgi:hypothetical protein
MHTERKLIIAREKEQGMGSDNEYEISLGVKDSGIG